VRISMPLSLHPANEQAPVGTTPSGMSQKATAVTTAIRNFIERQILYRTSPQVPINAVTGKVDSGQKALAGNATYRDLITSRGKFTV
jgi:hypothetical protein